MTPFIYATIEAAEKIKERLDNGWKYEFESSLSIGAGGDVTTGLDKMAEDIYIKYLLPFGRIDSEESGLLGDGSSRIILDPIDGSSNAISGVPYFGSSIALQESGKVKEAVVINFATEEVFCKASGPLMRGKLKERGFSEVVCRKTSKVGIFERAYAFADIVNFLHKKGLKFRSPGAVALSLAYAHYVEFVIFAGKRREYDFLAALKMCEELEIFMEKDIFIVSKSKKMVESLKEISYLVHR